jgi:hypothetical protein
MVLTALGGTRNHQSKDTLEYAECYLRYGAFQWTVLSVHVVDALSLGTLAYAMWRISSRPGQDDQPPAFTYRPVHAGGEEEDAEEKEPHGHRTGLEHARAEIHDHPTVDIPVEGSEVEALSSPTSPPPEESADFYAATPRRRSSVHKRAPVSEKEQEQSWAFGMSIFLILGTLWMMINLALSLWSATSNELREGRIELFLLDGVLSGGQAIWTWIVFGLASHVKSPLRFVTRWVQKQSGSVINWKSS